MQQTPSPASSNIFNSIKVVEKLSQGKFEVYLCHSKATKKRYALKIFPYQNQKTSIHYQIESRLKNLNHPSVIKYEASQDRVNTVIKGQATSSSTLLIEYAENGDLNDKDLLREIAKDEKLVRTYFHQLIEGMEYLHAKHIYHLDLKLENLLLDKNFHLKIADFDLCYMEGRDSQIHARGSKYFRSPELARGGCSQPAASDIYSAGIILFSLKSGGCLPHLEEKDIEGINLYKLLIEDKVAFFQAHCKHQKKNPEFFNNPFCQLFLAMTESDFTWRVGIEKIKESDWYKGPIYNDKELTEKMRIAFKKANN